MSERRRIQKDQRTGISDGEARGPGDRNSVIKEKCEFPFTVTPSIPIAGQLHQRPFSHTKDGS